MAIGIIGRKRGMTRIFTESGAVGVTVIEAEPNRVAQHRDPERDGYAAVQVTAGRRRPRRVTRPVAGHFAKAGVEAGEVTREFRLGAEDEAPEVGGTIGVDRFAAGQMVDVTGVSKGRGFSGTIRRHNFRGQRMSHGNSKSHRAPGAIGQCQTPGRVFKGKKMAGRLGGARATVQNLEVVRVDAERNLLLVRGAVPGPVGGDLLVYPAAKATEGA